MHLLHRGLQSADGGETHRRPLSPVRNATTTRRSEPTATVPIDVKNVQIKIKKTLKNVKNVTKYF